MMILKCFVRFGAAVAVSAAALGAGGPSWAQGECAPPGDAKFVVFDGKFDVRKSLESDAVHFTLDGGDVFPLESIRRQSSDWALQIGVVDTTSEKWTSLQEWVVVPANRLWSVRFLRTDAEFAKASSFDVANISNFDGDVGVLPCAAAERRAHAQGLFQRAFERLKANDIAMARSLFLSGLEIDSKNAAALFYYAEATRLAGEDKDSRVMLGLYERARALGLDGNADALAQEQILRLKKAVADDD